LGKAIIDSSPAFQSLLKLLNFGIMLILRPIGDFFALLFRPILIMLMRKFIIPFYQNVYPWFIKMASYGDDTATSLESIIDGITKSPALIAAAIVTILATHGIIPKPSSKTGVVDPLDKTNKETTPKAVTKTDKAKDIIDKTKKIFQGDQGKAKDYLGRTPQEVAALSKTSTTPSEVPSQGGKNTNGKTAAEEKAQRIIDKAKQKMKLDKIQPFQGDQTQAKDIYGRTPAEAAKDNVVIKNKSTDPAGGKKNKRFGNTMDKLNSKLTGNKVQLSNWLKEFKSGAGGIGLKNIVNGILRGEGGGGAMVAASLLEYVPEAVKTREAFATWLKSNGSIDGTFIDGKKPDQNGRAKNNNMMDRFSGKNMSGGGYSSGDGSSKYDKEMGNSMKEFANGGIITEQIKGIGRSGRQYMFGEKGAERVTPLSGGNNSKSSDQSITINMYGNISSEYDMQEFQRKVLQVIEKSNSRRSRI